MAERPSPTLASDLLLEIASCTGTYNWRPSEDQLSWSEGLVRIYGLREPPSDEAGFSSHVHPEDRIRVEAETANYLSSSDSSFSHTFRIIRPDGQIRLILDRGSITRDDVGRVVSVAGINIDLSDLPNLKPSADLVDETAVQRFAELEALYAEAPLGLGLLDRDMRFVRINSALAEMNGYSPEEHLQRRVWDLLPNLRQSAEHVLRQVLDTGLPLRNVAISGETPAHPGIIREWREHFYPIRGADGAVQGIGIVCEEVTERLAAERALAESEVRFRNMADHAPVMIWITEPDGACTYLSQSWYEFTGQQPQDALGFGWLKAVHPDDSLEAERVFRAANARHEGFRLDYRLRRADGSYRWAIDSARPRFDENGRFLGFIGSVLDISERKTAEETLRAAHNTFQRLVEGSPFGVYTIDSDFRIAGVSEGAKKAFKNVSPLIGRDLAEALRILWPEPFASEAISAFRKTLATGDPYHAPQTIERRNDTNATESYDWKLEQIPMPDGRPGVVCHFYDLSERQAHEEEIRNIMGEMNHRAKNMLTLVNAVARQTAFVGKEEFLARFSSRISALAASQDLLFETDREGAPIVALIESQLTHFKELLGRRILYTGPDLMVTAQAVQNLGMAFHELATNAAKYGALSNETGLVEISWTVSDVEHKPTLRMVWQEKNGPPVRAPRRSGFGQRVAGRMVEAALSARVKMDYDPDGFRWSLCCPLAEISHAKAL